MGKGSFSSRERLLEVVRILQEHTDVNHMLDIHEIHGYFPESSKVGIRGVRDDIQALEDSNAFPVISVQEKNGLKKHYYYDGRLFEIHELRLLMDAIVAAKFIPQNEAERLFMKIRKLTSQHLAKQLMNELYVTEKIDFNTQEVTTFVQNLHEAIHEKKLVTFQYGRYGTDLQFQLSNDGKLYEVKPLGLVWNRDRYYLIAHYIPKNQVRQYRVDRMRNVRVLEEDYVPDPDFNLQEHIKNMIYMYSGDMISLEAEFSETLINVVIDRFGLESNIQSQDNGKFVLKAKVAMSDGLIGWLLRWGSDVKVLHPPVLVHTMKEEIKKLNQHYE
ncbi:helix-turn-helix transcriptional regulator [Sporosarcina ureilytica]|uniref:Uncharacterized protein n=1 Tax=Sporosarcina ureilytica TaxID=298596 RepID=A0A1D8JEE4_9BACL|nr:WYL domain-containing protein [Sporosarcina ureilytica]AOV07081.1 hypothetical protein BI350_05655 [Sporosarcina ureilytica]